jgi:probable F420-dependent oxidoreductase
MAVKEELDRPPHLQSPSMTLTERGVWSAELRYGEPTVIPKAAAELEALGYTACWLPDIGGPLFDAVDLLLDATASMTVATGVLNIWMHSPEETLGWFDGLDETRRQRVLLGLGVGHAAHIGERWTRPLAVMSQYLDALDAGDFPSQRRCLAALGPKMLAMARDRSAGAHTYLVTPEHTAEASSLLGAGKLFVEQGVVVETDSAKARHLARTALELYVDLPNYANNWRRLGFTDDDIATRSDRLVDSLIAWGDADAIGERVAAHFAAGADHVCIQVIADRSGAMPLREWRALAPR